MSLYDYGIEKHQPANLGEWYGVRFLLRAEPPHRRPRGRVKKDFEELLSLDVSRPELIGRSLGRLLIVNVVHGAIIAPCCTPITDTNV